MLLYQFILNGTWVEIVTEFNYLGCILNCNLLEKTALKEFRKVSIKVLGVSYENLAVSI